MTDRNIPEVCRDCKFCRRYHEIGELTLYSWTPWKYECLVENVRKHNVMMDDKVCQFKEAK